MLQANNLWMLKGKVKKNLQVPVKIGEFIWYSSCSNMNEFYIFSSTIDDDGETYSVLLDVSGKALAYLSKVEFANTSVKLIESMIRQQSEMMPGLWQDVWKAKPGPRQNRLDLLQIDFPTKLSDSTETQLTQYNSLSVQEKLLRSNLSELTHYLFLRALYKLGWDPEPSTTTFNAKDLLKSLSILDCHRNFTNFFLRRLVKPGILKNKDDVENFSFTYENPPTFDEVSNHIQELMNGIDKTSSVCKLVMNVGSILHDALVGKASPLRVLFPEDASEVSVADFYGSEADEMKDTFLLTIDSFAFDSLYDALRPTLSGDQPFLRILEVGAGTGIVTRTFLEALAKRFGRFEYHFTDISPSFFKAAEKSLGENAKHVLFKKFDMDEDPLEQGFSPEYFDVVLAAEAIHIAKNVTKTLTNLRTLLRPGGIFIFEETITENPYFTFIFGLLEGYWRFEDFDIRRSHPTLTAEMWADVLYSVGFTRVVWRPAGDSMHGVILGWAEQAEQRDSAVAERKHAWLLFDNGNQQLTDSISSKLARVNRNVVILQKPRVSTEESMKLEIIQALATISKTADKFEGIIYLWGLAEKKDDRDQVHVSLALLTLLQLLPNCVKVHPKLVVVTKGTFSVSESQVENPSGGTLRGMMTTAMNENPMLDITHLDLSPNEDPLSQVDEIFCHLWLPENSTIAFRNGKRFVVKLAVGKIHNNDPLPLPNGCQRIQLQLPDSHSLSDLEFTTLGTPELGDDDVEVEVKAAALNFRDVFTVLKPISEFEELNTIGVDIAGRITRIGSKVKTRKVGQRIIGMNMNRNLALPSHATMRESMTMTLPSEMTYAEGSTFPVAFSTAILCLVQFAKMKRGETVIIHTASGGVGLASIQIARSIGANVIATAGSERKRNYLRKLIGIEHVFQSRTTDFGEEILRVTEGRGVDIVLNSLTGPGFKEASLDAIATNGRFIEMSKLNVWTREEVKQLRPDVVYEIADLGNLEDPKVYAEVSSEVGRLLNEKLIKPIPFERFDAVNIRGALAHLQKAEHIGKIVCIMPEVRLEKSKVTATTPLFNENSTYLVTGGQGGVGFEVVKWILKNGGKHVAIASRSKPNTKVCLKMSTWNKSGHHVEAFSTDVGDFDKCKKLVEHLASSSTFPPLHGVMHAAGVLQDAVLENQSWQTFSNTFNAKVDGTWNLHDLSKDLQLEHFVLFSSMAPILGTPAQANHSASNSFQDAFVYFRRSMGLPALGVNWGIWGQVGVATEVDLAGIRPISTYQGLHALETCLRTQTTRIGVANVDSFPLLAIILPKLSSFLDDRKLLGVVDTSTVIMNSDEFWAKVDAASSYDDKLFVFKEFIKTAIRSVLKFPTDEEVDDETEFQTLGIDSLMMLELRNGLQKILGQRMTLTVTQLKDCSTTQVLAVRLIDILNGAEYSMNMPSLDELKQLIREDSVLPPHVAPNEDMKRKDIDEIKMILLTGATGNLGPYLLRELSQRANIVKIYCLIRKQGKDSATNRLHSKLRDLEISNQVDMNKVECLEGDISHARFGLTAEKYDELANNVEAVVHSAALVHHGEKYWKAPECSRYSVRSANVLGTLKVLEFAVDGTLKNIFYISALAAAVSVDGSGRLAEDWQDVGAFDDIPDNVGYPVSKHICEQLIKQAIERGVPCTALRIPFLGGDSRTGRCHVATSNLHLRILLYMKLGCMPDVYIPIPVIAVDKCAEICLQLFFDERTSLNVIHIWERNPNSDRVIPEIAKEHGVHIDAVSFPDFLEQLQTLEGNVFFEQIVERYRDKFVTCSVGSPLMACFSKYLENGEDFFTNDKIRKLYIDFEETLEPVAVVLRRDFEFLKKSGVLTRIGICT